MPMEASRIKAYLMRRLGARVGRGVRFGRKSFILCRNFEETVIGDRTRLGDHCLITVGSLRTGDDVRFDSEVRVRGRGNLSLGHGCYVGARSYIDVNRDVVIEDDAGVGPGSWIFTHSVWQSVLEGGPRAFAPVRIEKNAWIPANVFIMPGVTVGAGSIVGARSLVSSDIPPGVFAAGTPARVIKTAEERDSEIPDGQSRRDIIASLLEDFRKAALELHIADDCKQQTFGDLEVYTFLRRAVTRDLLAVCTTRLRPEHLASVKNATTWFAAGGIDPSSFHLLKDCAWFDVELRRRSDDWDDFNELLHEVSRGEYGIRFRIAK